MAEVSTIGLDIAKQAFQVHAADAAGPQAASLQKLSSHFPARGTVSPPRFVTLSTTFTAV